ncbi:Zn-dependent alcohol dehydrogenase [Caldilinea sp.]|uniref:Zn-dependent alcohol dehydrogenase n=1 Tax=Caldilinea sp. TaxID=2293560 RepID=UPI002C9BB019|nr:Zn-dependent alcohol dehydrogenase [Caldilinea sp.]
MQTRTAVLHAVGDPISVETLDLSAPRAGEVRVRIRAAGVCHSDWHLISGATQHPLPAALGHEGAGEVVAVGPGVTRLQVGDSVSLNWAPACGECFYCLHDSPCLCDAYLEPIWAGVMLDGTPRYALAGQPVYHYCGLGCFSDYVVVPVQSCVLLDPRVPASVAALIGCAVTTGVGAVLNTAQVRPGSSVAIFGAGGVGMSMVLGAKLAGAARIIVVDRVAQKGEFAMSLGATHFVPAGDYAIGEIRALTGGRGVDYAFEAVGSPAVQEACLAAARPGGTIVLAGLAPMGSSTNLPGAVLTRQEKTVKGSYYGSAHPPRDFPFLASLYLDGLLDLDSLITRTYRLEEINSAYTEMLAGSVVRSVVLFE